MGFTEPYLTAIRSRVKADDRPLEEARKRMALVREIAGAQPGVLRTFASGSLAHHTMNGPVTDGDGAAVFDRRCFPQLGPDGGGESPKALADEFCELLGQGVRLDYPEAVCRRSKRGPKIFFYSPVDGQDPTVDLVLALTRKDEPGLWIPNLKLGTWDASHPERHTELFSGGGDALRASRRKVIRLLKAWNKQFHEPGLSSFHLSVLALEFVEPGMSVSAGMLAVFERAASRLRSHQPTLDPAHVSGSIRLLLSSEIVETRLRKAGEALRQALEHDNDVATVQAALTRLFPDYADTLASDVLASAVEPLRSGRLITTVSVGLAGAPVALAPTRAYGD